MSDIKDITFRDKNTAFRFFVLKAEKLATATYILTDSLKDAEPVKWRLRDRSVSLLSDLVSKRQVTGDGKLISEIMSLIDLAIAGRLVSEANFSILRREYAALRDGLADGDSQADGLDLAVPIPASAPSRAGLHLKSPPPQPRSVVESGDRATIITKLIKDKGPVQIKDIAIALPGLSSKTVQRELNRLVQNGVLAREGERRWSRYKLAG